MTRHDCYDDVTFTSMVRLDSPDRLENLGIVISYLRHHFPTAKLLFCEEDSQPSVAGTGLLHSSELLYIPNRDGLHHHRTRNMNAATGAATTPIVVSYDVDAIVAVDQLHAAIEMVRKSDSTVCNPFSTLRHMDGPEKARFRASLSTALIKEFRPYTASWKSLVDRFTDVVDLRSFTDQMADEATGLIIVHNREWYFRCGGANQNLLGHASEEMERHVRFTKLGLRWARVHGPAYHMTHARTTDDYIRNRHYEGNIIEMHRILTMSAAELRSYVDTWAWRMPFSEAARSSASSDSAMSCPPYGTGK